VPARPVTDREEIAVLLRDASGRRAYELGDLDDAEWPFTRWFGWYAHERLREVALLYVRPEVPVLVAVAPEHGPMVDLVDAIRDDLPPRLYAHADVRSLAILERRYAVEGGQPHLKLALSRTDLLPERASPVEALSASELDEVLALYEAAYPGTWFEPRQLATGRYVGIRRGGRLVSVAGVHVWSPPYRVAALGNVATLPELRGQGLAQAACASLCLRLLADGIETIALNVSSGNGAAVRAYHRLGFETVAEYVEASLVAR
jgi:ribosomal protein S18 acetylase RimI-like enzyme